MIPSKAEVVHSIVDGASLLEHVRGAYPVVGSHGGRCVLVQSGHSDVYRIDASGRVFYFKLYPANRGELMTRCGLRMDTAAQVEAQCIMSERLDRTLQFQVAKTLRARNGNAGIEVGSPEGTRLGLLQTAVPGSVGGGRQSRGRGKALRAFHDANLGKLGDYPFRHDRRWFIEAPRTLIRQSHLDAESKAFAERVGDTLLDFVKEAESDEQVVCHGDAHWKNFLFDDRGRAAIIDFDLIGTGSRYVDLGGQLWERWQRGYIAARLILAIKNARALAGVEALQAWLDRSYEDELLAAYGIRSERARTLVRRFAICREFMLLGLVLVESARLGEERVGMDHHVPFLRVLCDRYLA